VCPKSLETNGFREKRKIVDGRYLFAVFDDLERVMMSSEVFFKWQRPEFLLPFLIDLLIVYSTVKKIFNLPKKFPEKTYFL
jgi:hypothetical protein